MSDDRVRAVFWSFSLGLFISIPLMFVLEHPVWPESVENIIEVGLHCLSSVCTWFLYISAISYISGNTYSVITSAAVVLFLIPQYTILSPILPGHKNWMEVVGVFVVSTGSVLTSLQEMFHTRDRKP